jgi:phosphatidyl-myo-inositol dimannoside synthase
VRILYVSHSFPLPNDPLSNVGGMQRVAVDLHRMLGQTPGVQLTSLLLETSWRATGFRTAPFLLSLLRRIPGIVEREGIDVVLFSSMVTASVVPFLHRRIRASGAATAAISVGRDLTFPNPIYQRFVPRVLRHLDLVLPISRATAAAALGRGASADRVQVVPCGIDLQWRDGSRPRGEARAAILEHLRSRGRDVPEDALLLLSVGRHQERKGFEWFVGEVVPRLRDPIVYLVAGSGPRTEAIRQRARRSGVEERVVLLGQIPEDLLRLLYAGSDLFVMPNVPVPGDIEGFGVVMLEAGLAGLPVVAADLEGIRDVVTPGANGEVVTAMDGTGFVQAIERYRPIEIRRSASAASVHHVRDNFGWKAIVERYLSIFGSTITSGESSTNV